MSLISFIATSALVSVYIHCSVYFVITALVFTARIGSFKTSAFMAGIHR